MDEIVKLLKKCKRADAERLLIVLESLRAGQTQNLDIKKLKGANSFRARVGRYRVIFKINKQTNKIEIVTVDNRNENTYHVL